jgi:RNA polymerase sigma factor (sigma-70 family)
MTNESEAEDRRLFANGDIDTLLAKYLPVALNRCRARLKGHPDAEDVAQAALLRLVAEFHRGKTYGGTPYRVVVHKVIGWTLSDHYEGRRIDEPLPEDGIAADDPTDVVSDLYLSDLLVEIDGRDGTVARARYIDGLEPDEIAAALGMKRNAVDQALWRVRKKLREGLIGDE